MSKSRQLLGRWGESLAANYLQERGYFIVDRNVRTQYGEIDLIVCESNVIKPEISGTVVFVEVKTRTTKTYGYPEMAITRQKQTHMLESAQAYLMNHPELDCNWRVDVISILRNSRGKTPEITHFENVITS